MLLLGEQDFAASGHDNLDANSLVMVTLRQATSPRSLISPRFTSIPEHCFAAFHTFRSKPCLKVSIWARASSSTWSPTPLARTNAIHAGLTSFIASRNV